MEPQTFYLAYDLDTSCISISGFNRFREALEDAKNAPTTQLHDLVRHVLDVGKLRFWTLYAQVVVRQSLVMLSQLMLSRARRVVNVAIAMELLQRAGRPEWR